MDKIQEKCGVFGIFAKQTTDVASQVYYGLFALQHRGQEGCGIVVNDDGVFTEYKDTGIVNDVFTPRHLASLGEGNMALGHCQYGTDKGGRGNIQPLTVNHMKGRMAIAHNGAITNAYDLRRKLEMEGSIFHTTSDTEVIAYTIIKERLHAPSIEEAINRAMNSVNGAYSMCIMSPSKLIAVRDPNGFRPLCYGVTDDGTYIVASESCALNACGAKLIRDIKPGEILVFSAEGIRSITDHCGTAKPGLCVFEYVYTARPDSVVDGYSVHSARLNAGVYLARRHPVEADVVIGVPDSGLDAALGYSKESGIPYGIGFLKNKYIGRTFIDPGQSNRENKVRIKLNTIAETVRGKRVIMVDDSIVRGTTCARTIKLLRDAGATEVHMRVSSPPYINPCYFGTDIDSREKLIACRHSVDEIAKIIGVDSLGYLDIEDMRNICKMNDEDRFCLGCFTGEYPADIPGEKPTSKYDIKISQNNKSKE